jgi:hypothetical protein
MARTYIEGVSEKIRRLRFVGRAKLSGKEHLVFRPVRKARKQRRRAKKKRG